MEYATQDADPKVFEPLRKPINDRAAAFRQLLIDTEPKHLRRACSISPHGPTAGRLTDAETRRTARLCTPACASRRCPHDEAFRLTLARVLVSPAFLYRLEKPGPGAGQGPVSDWELASRLSYFLWSSPPDDELRAGRGRWAAARPDDAGRRRRGGCSRDPRDAAAGDRVRLPVAAHPRLRPPRREERAALPDVRRPARRHVRGVDPFFTDLFQHDGSVLDILDADHTFLNEDAGEALRHSRA